MNPEVKESEVSTTSPPAFAEPEAMITDTSSDPLLLPPATESNEQWRQIGDRVYTLLSGLPEYLSDFFGEYQRPLVTLGLIFGGIVAAKLTFALLDAADDIPLLGPTFELIGFGYSAWFVYRYLLRASSRQELSKDIEDFKNQVVGKLPK